MGPTFAEPTAPIRVCELRSITWRGCLRVEHEHEDERLGHPDKVQKETGPEIQHAAPGVTNLVIACRCE